jgi:hypothetical protein
VFSAQHQEILFVRIDEENSLASKYGLATKRRLVHIHLPNWKTLWGDVVGRILLSELGEVKEKCKAQRSTARFRSLHRGASWRFGFDISTGWVTRITAIAFDVRKE